MFGFSEHRNRHVCKICFALQIRHSVAQIPIDVPPMSLQKTSPIFNNFFTSFSMRVTFQSEIVRSFDTIFCVFCDLTRERRGSVSKTPHQCKCVGDYTIRKKLKQFSPSFHKHREELVGRTSLLLDLLQPVRRVARSWPISRNCFSKR